MTNKIQKNQNTKANLACEKNEDSFLYTFVKRICDIIISLIVLIVGLLPMIIVAIAIRTETQGKALYKDERVGKNGKIIYVYKFRSMYDDAEANINKYLNKKQKRQWKKERKIVNDPRTTRVGSFIRRTSIDEIPQFINVLLGQMSIVGSRPITINELISNFNTEEQIKVLRHKPGITGYWQVYGRCDDTWKSGKRKALILEYLNKRSFWLDAKLFLLTVPSCLIYSNKVLKNNQKNQTKNKDSILFNKIHYFVDRNEGNK